MIDAKKYFSTIVAALLVIGLSIGYFVYSLVVRDAEDIEIETTEISVDADGVPTLSPVNMAMPDHAPSVGVPDDAPLDI